MCNRVASLSGIVFLSLQPLTLSIVCCLLDGTLHRFKPISLAKVRGKAVSEFEKEVLETFLHRLSWLCFTDYIKSRRPARTFPPFFRATNECQPFRRVALIGEMAVSSSRASATLEK